MSESGGGTKAKAEADLEALADRLEGYAQLLQPGGLVADLRSAAAALRVLAEVNPRIETLTARLGFALQALEGPPVRPRLDKGAPGRSTL